jgi:hypothetical protein
MIATPCSLSTRPSSAPMTILSDSRTTLTLSRGMACHSCKRASLLEGTIRLGLPVNSLPGTPSQCDAAAEQQYYLKALPPIPQISPSIPPWDAATFVILIKGREISSHVRCVFGVVKGSSPGSRYWPSKLTENFFSTGKHRISLVDGRRRLTVARLWG